MDNTTDRILRIPDVCQITGLSPTTIWRYGKAKTKNGQFPARRRIGKYAVGYLESEIQAWLSSRPAIDK